MNQGFARRYRLTKTDEYSSVFGFRRAIRGKWLMLHYQPRADGETDARLGLVVAKKLLKRAIDRNKVKRVARDIFRRQRANLPSCDLIVRLASRPQPLDGRLIAEDLAGLLAKLGKLRFPRENE